MKTLYESILDNEDVLLNKSKETVQNPFELLYSLYKECEDLKKISVNDLKRIINLIDNPSSDFHLESRIIHNVDLQIVDSKERIIFTISPIRSEYNQKYWMVITPTEDYENIKYIWKSKEKQEQYFKNMFKKYNINYEKRLYDLYNLFYLKNK